MKRFLRSLSILRSLRSAVFEKYLPFKARCGPEVPKRRSLSVPLAI